VCRLVGITYRQLDYWARTDLLRPSAKEASGSGSQRLYSFTDLIQLKVIKRLLDAGMSLKRIRSAVEILRDQLESDQAARRRDPAVGRHHDLRRPLARTKSSTCSARARECSGSRSVRCRRSWPATSTI
jgi:DNA-binding transcriptional MerR regulator